MKWQGRNEDAEPKGESKMKRVLALSGVLLLAPIVLLAGVKTDYDHSVNFRTPDIPPSEFVRFDHFG